MRTSQTLIVLVVSLLAVGVIMVTSAGLSVGQGSVLTITDVVAGRPAQYAALAIVLMLVVARLPVMTLYRARGLASPVPWIVIVSIALLVLAHVPGIGHQVNGAWRWIRIGPVGFQPSELVKWGVPIVLAAHAARYAGSMRTLGAGFLVPMGVVGVLCALIATEDLGTAVLIGLVSVSMLFIAGTRTLHLAMLAPCGVLAFAAAVVASPYRIDRLRAFLDPYEDPQGIGFHVLQSMAAVSSGGIAGRGLGAGVQKFGYLPEDTTDFIFAIIAEELGVAGVAIVLALYAALVITGLGVARRATHPFRALLALGIVLTIALQTLINLLVVTGLAPTKGIALPLISSGGTGWCLTALSVGILIAIERAEDAAEVEPDVRALPAPARRALPAPADAGAA